MASATDGEHEVGEVFRSWARAQQEGFSYRPDVVFAAGYHARDAEVERLRSLLLHRCLVKQIDVKCADCVEIDNVIAGHSVEIKG